MKKYEIIIDITNNSLAFCPGYYIYIKAIFLTILNLSSLSIEIIAVKIQENITS